MPMGASQGRSWRLRVGRNRRAVHDRARYQRQAARRAASPAPVTIKASGRRAGAVYLLIETCKLNAVDRRACGNRDVQLPAGHSSIETAERCIHGDTCAQRRLVALGKPAFGTNDGDVLVSQHEETEEVSIPRHFANWLSRASADARLDKARLARAEVVILIWQGENRQRRLLSWRDDVDCALQRPTTSF